MNPTTIELHDACGQGDAETAMKIIRENLDAIDWQHERNVPIQRTIPKHPELLNQILNSGENPNREVKRVNWFEWEDRGADMGLPPWRLIHQAALHGYDKNSTRTIDVLIENGAKIDAPSPLDGLTALHLATVAGMNDNIRCFLKHGIDVNTKSTRGKTNIDWSQLMEMKYFVPFPGLNETPLMIACGEGHLDTCRLLIDSGADVNATDGEGYTPLHFAAGGFWQERENEYVKIAKRLMDTGAATGAESESGTTPSDLAKSKNRQKIVELFC